MEEIDRFLGGGVPSKGIIEVFGESATCKTLLCIQLSLTVQRPIALGGLDAGGYNNGISFLFGYMRIYIYVFKGRMGLDIAIFFLRSGCAYICTENAFPVARLDQLIRHSDPEHAKRLTDNIFIEHVVRRLIFPLFTFLFF